MTKLALKKVAPDIVDLLEQADDAARRRAATAAVELALQRIDLRAPQVADAKAALAAGRLGDTPERTAVEALTEELDEAAWDLQEQVESGLESQELYLAAFAKARAAAALAFAFEPNPLDAAFEVIYEANFAVQDLEDLKAVVTAAIDR
ncbi:MAG: hypothetical protein ACRDTD_02960 [Pseudonocardiaceae bacterium]